MKKLLVFAAMTALVAGLVFIACKKEENKVKKSLIYNGESVLSYTGNTFCFDENFNNSQNYIGEYHNIIVNQLAENWNYYENANLINYNLLNISFNMTEQLMDINIIDYGIDKDSLIDNLNLAFFESFDTNETFINNVKLEFISMNAYFENFFVDIDTFLYGDLTIEERLNHMLYVEQKVYNSTMSNETKDWYLVFCAVLKYSMQNLITIAENSSHPFYYYLINEPQQKGLISNVKTFIHDHASEIVSDACGAVKWGRRGAQVGAVGGPGCTIAMGALGAVAGGALTTATTIAAVEGVKQICK